MYNTLNNTLTKIIQNLNKIDESVNYKNGFRESKNYYGEVRMLVGLLRKVLPIIMVLLLLNPINCSSNNYTDEDSIIMICEVTAYSKYSTCGGRDDGLTASGVYGIPNYSCAMENVPFGTKIRLPDGRVFEVHDRFGHGKSGYLDLYLDNEEECIEWGRRTLEVEIIYEE